MGIPWHEYWSGLPFLCPGHLHHVSLFITMRLRPAWIYKLLYKLWVLGWIIKGDCGLTSQELCKEQNGHHLMWFPLCNQSKGLREFRSPQFYFLVPKFDESVNFLKLLSKTKQNKTNPLMQSPYNFNTNTHILKCKISYRMEKQLKIPAIMVTNNKNNLLKCRTGTL